MRNTIINSGNAVHTTFPEICEIVDECITEEFPYLNQEYFQKLRFREVAEIAYSLICFEVVDFRDEWVRYNRQYIQMFVREFGTLNDNLKGYTEAHELIPLIILHIA